MPTTPYAKLLVSVNAGGVQSGGLTVATGDVIQLSAESTVGWGAPAARWEIYDYPTGFGLPSGWTLDSDTGVYFYLGNSPAPPSFTIGPWGKYMLRLTALGGNTATNFNLVDDSTALTVPSANGLADTAYLESDQFSATKKALAGIQANWRIIEAILTGGIAPLAVNATVETDAGGVLSATANTKGGSAATASTYVKRDGSAGAAFGWLSVGSSPAASGDFRVPDLFTMKAGGGALTLLESSASLFTVGNAGRDLLLNGSDFELQVDASGVNVTSTATGELDIQVPSGIFNVNAAAAVSCVGGAASTFGCTAGDLTLGAASNTAKATLSSGTAGNAVSVEANANTDAITCTVNGTASLALSATTATLGVPSVTWGGTVTAPTIQQAARTTDAAPRSITLASQAPYASSTGTNRDAPSVILEVPAPAAGGTDGKVSIKINGGTERASIDRYSGVFNLGNSGKTVRVGAYYPGGTAGTGYAAIYFGSNADSPNSGTYGFLGDNADTYLNAPTGVLYFMKAGNVHSTMTISGAAASYTLGASTSLTLTADSAAATIAANKAQALTISIGAQTSEAAPKDMTLQPGAPWGSASSAANKKPGDLVINLNTPTSGGTDHGRIIEQRGSSKVYSYYKELQTTDGSSQVVFAFSMSDNTKVAFKAVLLSSRTDSGTAVDGADLFAVFKRRGGGATVVGAMSTDLKEDLAYTSITATVSGNDAQITIQMRGAETWQHDVWIDVYETGTA